jgi:hypothetical protein
MCYPIYRDSSDADIIMRIVASLDMYPGIIFGTGLHTGKSSDESYRVGVAEYFWQILDPGYVDFCYSS